MCGLAGFVGQGNLDDLERMTRALAHRGPDAEALWQDPARAVFLGHRRLTVLDPEGGAQPMWSADGKRAIVFNGEIYNHMALRAELEGLGHRFRSDHSDTETLLVGYAQWGAELQTRLNGMWAFVIYDRALGKLFCSRDRFGQKPFYFHHRPGLFAFSSELESLVRHDSIPASPSTQALKKYFAYGFIPGPLAFYEGVNKLPGGCWLEFDLAGGGIKQGRYWRFRLEPDPVMLERSEAEIGEQLSALLDRAVVARFMADVPCGVFLSGGLDSSAVASFACDYLGKGVLHSFSAGFDEAGFDESGYAQTMARRLGTRHHMQRFSLQQIRGFCRDVVRRLDEPLGDPSLMPCFGLAGIARDRVKVVLGGDGADELFAGYDPFKALAWARLYQRVMPKPLHGAVALLVSLLPVSHAYMSLDFKLKRGLLPLGGPAALWAPRWMAPLGAAEVQTLLEEPVSKEELFSEAMDLWDRCSGFSLVDRTLQFFCELYLQDDILVKVDRANMMFGLEYRAPFLDINLVDFVRRLPHQLKFRHGTGKYILRKALATRLPPEIINRRKQGFAMPVGAWFKKGDLDFDDGAPAAFLNTRMAAQKLEQHRRGVSDQRLFLWCYWVLQQFLQGRSGSGPQKP